MQEYNELLPTSFVSPEPASVTRCNASWNRKKNHCYFME